MTLPSALDERIFAIDRKAVLVVTIDGQVIPIGLGEQGNVKAVDVDFDIEQLPPTASIIFSKEQLTDVASGIPAWVERGMDVWIDGGYDGELARIFTGRVKRRRHEIGGDVLECLGRTGKLTRPYRVDPPKVFRAITARAAIIDILNDFGVDFTSTGGEKTDIDLILMNDGNPWIMGTVVDAVLDMAAPSDMIRKIADVYGHRVYELPSGTLRIRPLLEVPAPTGFRTYSTDAAGADQTTQTTLNYSDSNIDAPALLGNVAANTRRSQGFIAGASGTPLSVSFWARRVGNPTDRLRFSILQDNGSGLPSVAADARLGGGQFTFNGQLLDLVTYTQVTIPISSALQLVSGTTYQIEVARSDALDAVNYYEIGIDQTAPGYADGVAGVFDGAVWAAEDAGGDGADHPFEIIINSFATLRVLNIGDDEDEDQVKKRIVVRGASVPDRDAEDNVISRQITETNEESSNDLVAGDPELFAVTYLNDLIDTSQVATDVALRLINKYHRLLQTIEIEVPFDPRMQLGTTITIDDPAVTGLGGNWWVHGYRHTLSSGNAVTQLGLFGGDQGGTTGEILPQPDFTWFIERELIGNALMAIITFTDASHDRDGWIANYRWQDNYAGGANDVSGELTSVTFAYDPGLDPAIDMTLTVTDNLGNVVSVTHTIDITTDNADIYAPIVSCAAGNTCMATFDGGLSWVDIATPSGDARETAITYNPAVPQDEMMVLFGTTTGRIYRSIDGMATLVLEYTDSAGDAITSIKADRFRRGIVWATTTDRVLLSLNFGDTWSVYTDFKNSANWPRVTSTTVMSALSIDGSVALGDTTARQLWATVLNPTISGHLGTASFWLRRVGTPTDSVRMRLYTNSAGEPDTVLATSNWIAGSTISNSALVQISFSLNNRVNDDVTYHLVIERSGSADAANHYLVAFNNLGASDFFGLPGPDWTAVSDSLVFRVDIVSGAGHVASVPPDPRPINAIEVSDPSINRIWVFGGRGDIVESWFSVNYLPNGGSSWHSEISQGDGVGAQPRNAFETVVDYVVSHDTSGDLGLIFARSGDDLIGQVWHVDVSGAPDFVDETTDANDIGNADWTIFPAVDDVGDYVALGLATRFSEVVFDNANGTAGVGGVIVWEYWDGSAWAALTGVTDGTTGFTIAAVNAQSLTFTVPGDWAAQVLNGSANLFYIRARITTVFSTNPIYDQGFIRGVPVNPYIFTTQFYPVGAANWQVGGGAFVSPGSDGVSVAGNNNQLEQFGAVLDDRAFYVSNDGIGWWPIPDVLPGTDANRWNDLLNVAAWRDIYLAATDEGVAKSIDWGATWAFFRPVGAPINTTWPVGAIGHDIAIEYRRPRAFNLASIVRDSSASTENALAIRTQTGGWEDHGPLPTAHADRPHRLWHFPQISDQVLFYSRYIDAGFNHQEQLFRTPDQGATWVAAPAPLVTFYAMDRSPDGTLWATGESHAAGTGQPHEIFRSTDDGLSWELMFSDATQSAGVFTAYRDIVVDPNDSDRVMVVGWFLVSNFITLVSTDATRGLDATWTRQDSGFNFEGIAARHLTQFVLAGEAERWIIGFQPAGVNRLRIYTNDQNGAPAAWTLRYDVATAGATFGFGDRLRAGNILFAIGTQIGEAEGILRSINNGDTWEVVNIVSQTADSATWDAQTNMLIIGRQVATDRFLFFQPPEPGAIGFTGIETGLDTAMGYTARPMTQGLVILRPASTTSGSPTELWAIAQLAAAGGDTDIWLREAVSDSWRNYLDMPDTLAAENRFPIWHFPGMDDVMFRLKIGDLGDAAFGYGGPLERSNDRGLIWTTVLANAGSLTRGRDGFLWATADDRAAPAHFQPRSIYRSLNGVVWTLMGTDVLAGAGGSMTKYTQIRVDPADAGRIMAVGGLEADTMRSAYSTDGGLTWDFRSGSMSFRSGTAADGNFINLEAGGAGRWIIGLSQSDGLAKFMFVSDNSAQNWTQKYTVITTAITFGWVDSVRTGGGNLYMAGNGGGAANATDGRVVVSTDNGDTWAPFTGDDRTSIMAVTYDNSQSTLYIGRADTANNVLHMQNPAVLGIWADDSIPSDPRFILQEGLKVVP